MSEDEKFMAIAIEEGRQGLEVNGLPVGAAFVSADGKLLGRGRNLRVQEGNTMKHAETVALEDCALNYSSPGPTPASVFRGGTMYTTLLPCAMCAGSMLLFGLKRVVYGCRMNVASKPDTIAILKENGLDCKFMEVKESEEMLNKWIKENKEIYESEPWAV